MFPDERRRIFEQALSFAERHVASDDKLREAARDPASIHAVNRYHGPGHDYAQHMISEKGQRGRGTCSQCGHPTYFDDRVPPDQRPARQVCMVCLLDVLVDDDTDTLDAARVKLTCPDWCPHG